MGKGIVLLVRDINSGSLLLYCNSENREFMVFLIYIVGKLLEQIAFSNSALGFFFSVEK